MSIQSETIEELDEAFCKLNILDFISSKEIEMQISKNKEKKVSYDLYLRLSEKKYVHVVHKGEEIPIQNFKAYSLKGVRFIFMKKEDFQNYIGVNINLIQEANKHEKVTSQEKMKLLKHTGEIVLNHLYTSDIDASAYESAKTVIETATEILADSKPAFDLIEALNEHADHLYAHSVAVSFYSCLIARQLQWTAPVTLTKISIAGLLHDIGKKELPKDIINKPRIAMTPHEIKVYETHPLKGMELLSKVEAVPREVLQIILQHHEDCTGHGYPQGLKRGEIHPLAKLISVADKFAEYVVKGPECSGISPKRAFSDLLLFYSGSLDTQFLYALMEVFEFEPPKQFVQVKWE